MQNDQFTYEDVRRVFVSDVCRQYRAHLDGTWDESQARLNLEKEIGAHKLGARFGPEESDRFVRLYMLIQGQYETAMARDPEGTFRGILQEGGYFSGATQPPPQDTQKYSPVALWVIGIAVFIAISAMLSH